MSIIGRSSDLKTIQLATKTRSNLGWDDAVSLTGIPQFSGLGGLSLCTKHQYPSEKDRQQFPDDNLK